MRRLIFVGLLAFAVALVGTAYAEVQNVKVSGDLDMKWISQDNFDLKAKQGNIAGIGTGGAAPAASNDDGANFFLSTVRVKVDADLSDNVSTSVRLINQRIWDTNTADQNDINIDNAYVVLKEFLYSPLTLIIGRQDLNYGDGFIVGPGLLADPDAVFSTGIATGPHGLIGQQYSAYNSYDAIRAILDFAPVTVDLLYAKINETGISSDDQDLYGLVVNYKVGQWDAEVEPYWFYKADESAAVVPSDQIFRSYDNNYVHTVGLRLAGSPIENLKLSGEGAHQRGEIVDDTPHSVRQRNAWAASVDARYTWAQVRWTPVTGAGWVYYSGEESTQNGNNGERRDSYNAWDVMYRGKFDTYIQDFFAGNDGTGLYTTFDTNDTAADNNRHLLYADASLKLLEDVTLWARFTNVRFDKPPRSGRSKDAGRELDWKAVYDYTEDVQLGVYGGFFFPGRYYDQNTTSAKSSDTAWTVGTSAVVKF